MEDKEATPVEDMEMILPPIEPTKPRLQKELPEVPTQTGDVNITEKQVERSTRTENGDMQEMFRLMMDCLLYTSRCV